MTKERRNILVTGAGGFIGANLVLALSRHKLYKDCHIIAVDHKPLFEWAACRELDRLKNVTILVLDMSKPESYVSLKFLKIKECYHLAADMGGIGYILQNGYSCMKSTFMDMQMVEFCSQGGIRLVYTSSACVYNKDLQTAANRKTVSLQECQAFPANPDSEYGWQKLYTELLIQSAAKRGFFTYGIARLHNCYGPYCDYNSERAKAPAALAAKIIVAKYHNHKAIQVWGTGKQTRSFIYVDDCIAALIDIMHAVDSFKFINVGPVNVGYDKPITIANLAKMLMMFSGRKFRLDFEKDEPVGVNNRNSDNTMFRNLFGWQPSTSYLDGMRMMYDWIANDFHQ